jgi:hypothetical protein
MQVKAVRFGKSCREEGSERQLMIRTIPMKNWQMRMRMRWRWR